MRKIIKNQSFNEQLKVFPTKQNMFFDIKIVKFGLQCHVLRQMIAIYTLISKIYSVCTIFFNNGDNLLLPV